MRQMGLSARTFHHVLKLPRTIADPSAALRAGLAGSNGIGVVHPSASSGQALAEALQYPPREKT